jgi:hypothetical protein
MTAGVEKIVELSGNWRLGVWFISSGIVLWIIWKITLFFAGKRQLLAAMIIYLPVLLGLAFCGWAYFIGTKVLGMSVEVKHLRSQMVRYVMPRQLTPEQIASIGEYLSHQERNQVVMQIINRDEEASSYRADIQRALEKGGWAISDFYIR